MGRKKISASNPRTNETEIGKGSVDRIIRRPTFNFYDRPQVGVRFHIFHQKGEQLEGELVGGPFVNVRRSSSWAIRLDENNDIVEIFANKTLHAQLKKAGLFARIRIVYIGYEQTAWGHAKKIFRVYKTN